MTSPGPVRRSKHAARSEATRAELIRLGLERLPVRGYAATSIRDIVAGSSLTKGAFDYHYPTKAEFFLDLLQTLAGPDGGFAALARERPAASLEEAVAGVLFARPAGTGPDGAWLLAIGDFLRTDGAAPECRARLLALYTHWRDEIGRWIVVLQEQALARRNLPLDELAESVYAAVEGFVLHMALYGRGRGTVVRTVARILMP